MRMEMRPEAEEKKENPSMRNTGSEVIIDSSQPYQEFYSLRMLKNNRIPGLLQVRGCGREGASRYYYHTEGALSLEKKYKDRDLRAEEILKITRQFLVVTEWMKDFLLSPDGLLLSEEYIFEKSGKIYFCFLPVHEKSWQLSYHELTEYFVRKVDYKDMDSVLLACMLHKETLKETYDLKQIIGQYEEEAKQKKKQRLQEERKQERQEEKQVERTEPEQEEGTTLSETMIFQMDEENGHYHRTRENLAVMEEKRYGPLKKLAKRLKTGRWGEWEDLITEADDYERPM